MGNNLTTISSNTILEYLSSILTHVAFYSDFALGSFSTELGRVAISNKSISGKILTCTYTLDTATANCLSTTVSNEITPTTTKFALASVDGLSTNGNGIEIGGKDYKILNRIGKIVEIEKALPTVPTAGTVVKQKIMQRAIIQKGSIINPMGDVADYEQFILYKDSTISQTNETWTIEVK